MLSLLEASSPVGIARGLHPDVRSVGIADCYETSVLGTSILRIMTLFVFVKEAYSHLKHIICENRVCSARAWPGTRTKTQGYRHLTIPLEYHSLI
jgi:hypothetical protein